MENKTVIREIAAYVKKEYDKRYPSNGKATDGVYHCVCGTPFACESPSSFDVLPL